MRVCLCAYIFEAQSYSPLTPSAVPPPLIPIQSDATFASFAKSSRGAFKAYDSFDQSLFAKYQVGGGR
jgi:hypothetical protein